MKTDPSTIELESEWNAQAEAWSAAGRRLDDLADQLGRAYIESGSYGIEHDGFSYGVLASGDAIEEVGPLSDRMRATFAGRAFGHNEEMGSYR